MMHQSARDPRPRRFDPTLLLAFLLPVFAWAPLTYPGYFVFHSGYVPIFNLVDRLAHLGDLGWLPAVGTGDHLFSGEGPLPYLLAALPAALGASPPNAVKWVFAAAFVGGSVGAYLWVRQVLSDGWPALVAAALYVFSPLWLPAVYTYGAFAQAVLFALMPWVLWSADAATTGRRAATILLALFAAACMWTQALLGILFLVTVLVYLLVRRRAGQPSYAPFAWVGLAGGALLGVLGLITAATRHGLTAIDPLAAWQWLILLAPWLALLAGWMAARLAAMLPEEGEGARAALSAALIALPLLAVYGDLQPVASANAIPSAPLAIFGQNEIALLSVQPVGTPGPGGRVAVDVEWQALKPLQRDYTVFFHVLGPNDQRYGQLDTMPQGGKLPTSQWQPGQVVKDRYEVVISPDAPIAKDYRYWLGWYLGETGQRLSTEQPLPAREDDKYVVKP